MMSYIAGQGLLEVFQQHFGDSSIVGIEIGVCQAHTSQYLLENLDNLRFLMCVDPWTPYQGFYKKYDQSIVDKNLLIASKVLDPYIIESRCQILKETSKKAFDNFQNIWRDPVDFVFIDGDHSKEAALQDLLMWSTLIRPGGIVSGHDFGVLASSNVFIDFQKRINTLIDLHTIQNESWYFVKK